MTPMAPRLSSVLFALTLLSPLLWVPGYGYDGVRLPLVLALTTLLLGMQALRSVRGRRRPAPLLVAALLLFGANLLSLAAARSPGESIVPLLNLFAGIAVFSVVRGGTVARDFVLEGVPIVISLAGLGISSIGLVQTVGFGMPAVSTEGNTNYSGSLAGILFPATVAFAFSGRGAARRVLPGLAAASLLALLLVTKSRGGWAGAVAGTAVAAGALLWRRVPGARIAVLAGIVLVAVPLALEGRKQVSESGSGSVTFRLETWKGALRMVAARPILGAGPGQFAVEYPPYRTEAEFRASHRFAGADFKEVEDAHSAWVQAAVETGIPGALLLLLVVYVAARLWRYYVRASGKPEEIALLAGMGGGATAFLVAGLFNTLTLHASHTILFWSFLGMIERVGGDESRQGSAPSGQAAIAVPLAAAIAGGFGVWISWMMALGDRELTAAMGSRDPQTRVRHLERAVDVQPAPWKARFYLERTYAAMGRPVEAIAAGRETLRFRPHHVAALNNLAAGILRAGGDQAEAERALLHAADVAPYYYLSHFNLGSLRLREKRYAEARMEFARAVKANDRHASSEFSLAETFALEGDSASALPHFRRARELGLNVGAFLRQEHPALANDPAYAEFSR